MKKMLMAIVAILTFGGLVSAQYISGMYYSSGTVTNVTCSTTTPTLIQNPSLHDTSMLQYIVIFRNTSNAAGKAGGKVAIGYKSSVSLSTASASYGVVIDSGTEISRNINQDVSVYCLGESSDTISAYELQVERLGYK